ADQRAKLVLVEHLRDQALVADGHDLPAAWGRGDPGRLLAAVLKREQGEVGDAGDVVSRRKYAEDAALVARAIAMVIHGSTHSQPAAKASSGPRPIRTARRPEPCAARKQRRRTSRRPEACRHRPRQSRQSRPTPRGDRTR